MTRREFEVTDNAVIEKILATSKVLHLGLVDEGMPYVVPMNYGYKTEDGKLTFYVDEGEFTDDNIEKEFFGCGGVAKISDLQRKLIKLGRCGFRHHTTVGVGHISMILKEAFEHYLGYDVMEL